MEFKGEFRFLSNFWWAPVQIEHLVFPCAENAYQAVKCPEDHWLHTCTVLQPGTIKRMGRSVKLRPDWEQIKLPVMTSIVTAKFNQNPDLMRKLKAIDGQIIEGNQWGDTYWGVCNGVGKNHLGKILMRIRDNV